MSRRYVRSCVAPAVMAVAGGLAGPAAGQSSAWYNTTGAGGDMAQTSRPVGTSRILLAVACAGPSRVPVVVFGLTGPLADWAIDNADLSGMDNIHFAFRFDGRPDTEIVLPATRNVAPGNMVVVVRDAAALIPSLQSAGYAETGAPGGEWQRWSLARSADAIDRLPCYGGGA